MALLKWEDMGMVDEVETSLSKEKEKAACS